MKLGIVFAVFVFALAAKGYTYVEAKEGVKTTTPKPITRKLHTSNKHGDLATAATGRKDRQTQYHSQQDSKPQSYSHSYDSGPQYYESTSKPVRYYQEYHSPPASYSHSYNTGPRSSSHQSPPQRTSHRDSYNHQDGDERSYDSENDRGHGQEGGGVGGGGDEYGGSNSEYENNADDDDHNNDEGYGSGEGEGSNVEY